MFDILAAKPIDSGVSIPPPRPRPPPALVPSISLPSRLYNNAAGQVDEAVV